MTYISKPMDADTLRSLRSNLGVDPICDFCGNPEPMFVFMSIRMSTGVFMRCWRWCACWTCADALDREDWDIIEGRLVIKLRKVTHVPSIILMKAVKTALEEFHSYSIKL